MPTTQQVAQNNPVLDAISRRMSSYATGGRSAPRTTIDYTGTTDRTGTTYNNPLVTAYGGPAGLLHAMSGANADRQWQEFYNKGYAQQEQQARQHGQGVPRPYSVQGSGGMGGGGVGGGGYGGGFGTGNIQTSINPTPIYSPEQTQSAVSGAVADAHVGANLPWLQGRFQRQGMSSSSPAAMARAAVPYAGALSQAEQSRYAIPTLDTQADAQHLLAGQAAREGEAIDWARLMSMVESAQRGQGVSAISGLLGLLNSFGG